MGFRLTIFQLNNTYSNGGWFWPQSVSAEQNLTLVIIYWIIIAHQYVGLCLSLGHECAHNIDALKVVPAIHRTKFPCRIHVLNIS